MFTSKPMMVINTFLAALAVTLTVLAASPAPASASYSACPSYHFCLFDNDDGGGAILFELPGPNLTPGCHNLTSANNDRAASVVNRSNNYVSVWPGYNCATEPCPPSGTRNYVLVPPAKQGNFDGAGWPRCGVRDKVSSVYVLIT